MINLKIGRHVYSITPDDRFMDNGKTVQLLTQSKELTSWGRRPNPVLSKKAIAEIYKFEKKKQRDHGYPTSVSVFSLSDA